MASFTVANRARNSTRDVRLGFEPVTTTIAVATTTAKLIGAKRQANIAAARAEDIANQRKAFEWFDGPTPMGSRDKNWGSDYICKNPSFYTPDIVAQSWAYQYSFMRTKDFTDPAVHEKMVKKFPLHPVDEMQSAFANFITLNPQYYPKALIDMAAAYHATGGKSYDYAALAQPPVSAPGAGPAASPVGAMTASMFSGGAFPVLMLSGIGITIIYKLFIEKKPKSKSRRKR